MQARKQSRDLYADVTKQIVDCLARGVRPWACPWTRGSAGGAARPVRHTGEPYRGINVLLLWGAATARGYSKNSWMTFKQAEASGARVRQGETGTMVVYAGRPAETADPAEDGVAVEPSVRPKGPGFLRAYWVFNAEQVDGLAATDPAQSPTAESLEVFAGAEAFFDATGARIRHGGDRAYYAPGADLVQLPEPQSFRDGAAYVATKAHELAHWTGHTERLAREFGQRFGDAAYAVEELVAELCAAFVCADMKIGSEPRDDHAAYLADCLRVLGADSRAIFAAAAHAQRAADYLHSLQPGAEAASHV